MDDLIDQFIKEQAGQWKWLLGEIRDFLMDKDQVQVEDIHREIIGITKEHNFSGYDLAKSLLFLLKQRRITGRLGKVILEFQYEFVKKAEERGVRDLIDNLDFGKK